MDLQQLINDLNEQVGMYLKEEKLTQDQAAVIYKELDALRVGDDDLQKRDLDWVNFACIFLKVGLNVYWEDHRKVPELDFYIEHKSASRGRRQTEEIEPDVHQIEVRVL